MLHELETIKDKVGYLLEHYPELRDSDKKLWLGYLIKFHGLREMLGDEMLKKLQNLLFSSRTPTMESIRRVRQKYQEDGFYQGQNRRERLQEEERVRDYFRRGENE